MKTEPATTAAALLKSQADSLESIRRLALALVVVASLGTATLIGTVARVWWLASQAQSAAQSAADSLSKSFNRPASPFATGQPPRQRLESALR